MKAPRWLSVAAVAGTLGCESPSAPEVGTLRVTTTTTGLDTDADGYSLRVGGRTVPIGATDEVHIDAVRPGNLVVSLEGIATNCAVTGATTITVEIASGDAIGIAFALVCHAAWAVVEVSAPTTGADIDGDGYTVRLDQTSQQLLPNGTATFPGITVGDHSLFLGHLAHNCEVTGGPSQGLAVTAGRLVRDTIRTAFEVACGATTALLKVTVTTTGPEEDTDGYLVRIDGSTPVRISPQGELAFLLSREGDHMVELQDLAPNCIVSDGNPRTLRASLGGPVRDTVRAGFAVRCSSPRGAVRIQTATTGADLPDGYTIGVDCDDYGCWGSWEVDPNGAITLGGLTPGPHHLALLWPAGNCAVAGSAERQVNVVADDTVLVAFVLTCAAFGRLVVTTLTTGVDQDADGYVVSSASASPRWTQEQVSVQASGSATIPRLVPGSHGVRLLDRSMNCEVIGPDLVTVTIPSGGAATVTFRVTCGPAPELSFSAAAPSPAPYDIYRVRLNDAAPVQLTADPAWEGDPAWSPDGSRIAFTSTRGGQREIWLMNADGSGQTRLTREPFEGIAPSWSPDGTRIVFANPGGYSHLYVVSTDGSGLYQLTAGSTHDLSPAWSPDGTRIAFARNGALHSIHLDGTGLVRLTGESSSDVDDRPAWAPDGRSLAFHRDAGCDEYGCASGPMICILSLDRLVPTTCPHPGRSPAWSPDGKWIAFNASSSLALIHPDGSGLQYVSLRSLLAVSGPSWRR